MDKVSEDCSLTNDIVAGCLDTPLVQDQVAEVQGETLIDTTSETSECRALKML